MEPNPASSKFDSEEGRGKIENFTDSNLNEKLPSLLEPLPFETQRQAVIDQLLEYNSTHSGRSIEVAEWARNERGLRALHPLAREPRSPSMQVGAFFGFEYKNEDRSTAHDFYDRLGAGPVTPTSLYEALKLHPAHEEALSIAKGLLQYSPEDRALGLSLLTELCRSDLELASPTVINWTGALLRWLLEHIPDEERHTVTDVLPEMFRVASPSFFKMLSQALLENLQEDHSIFAPQIVYETEPAPGHDRKQVEQRIHADLREGLARTGTVKAFVTLLGAGLSERIPEYERNKCLEAIVTRPLAGAPALNRFVARIYNAEDPEKRSKLASLLSSIDTTAGTYWGSLVPWAYEHPLRLLELQQRDPLQVWRESCPSVSAGAFLFGYGLAHGDSHVLGVLEQVYQTASESDAAQWLRVELKKGLIRCSFLSPLTQCIFLSEELPQLRVDEVAGCLNLITLLGVLPTRQRREFPQLAVKRLELLGPGSASSEAAIETWLERTYEGDSDRSKARVFAEIPPSMPLDEQVQRVVAGGLPEWLHDQAWYANTLGDSSQQPLSPFPQTMLALDVVHQYIRAQTIEENHLTSPLLKELGTALVLCDPSDRERWESHRYDETNPWVARQLRALTPVSRAKWRKDLMALVEPESHDQIEGIQGRPPRLFLAVLTGWPEFMLKIGKFPIMTAACTAFDSGAYYSRGLMSYLSDSHIKASLLFDMERLIYYVAPQLPQEAREPLLRGVINQDDLYRHAGLFLQACVSRTIVKLVEDEFKRPFLFMQPSFVRGSLHKQQPNLTTVKFLAPIAQRLEVGLASAVFVPDPASEQKPLFMAGALPARALTIPPSRSPGGQIENWDNSCWMAGHRGAAEVIGLELLAPPEKSEI